MKKFTDEQLLEIKRLIAIKDVKRRIYKKLIDTIWDVDDRSNVEKNITATLKAGTEHNAATLDFINYLRFIKKVSAN